jgi:hypothetical protein
MSAGMAGSTQRHRRGRLIGARIAGFARVDGLASGGPDPLALPQADPIPASSTTAQTGRGCEVPRKEAGIGDPGVSAVCEDATDAPEAVPLDGGAACAESRVCTLSPRMAHEICPNGWGSWVSDRFESREDTE